MDGDDALRFAERLLAPVDITDLVGWAALCRKEAAMSIIWVNDQMCDSGRPRTVS